MTGSVSGKLQDQQEMPPQFLEQRKQELVRWATERLILGELLSKEAKKAGIEITEELR